MTIPERPIIVCLCGSTRFKEAFVLANLRETLKGNIVLTIGCDMKTDAEIFDSMPESVLNKTKRMLDALHLEKIRLADVVKILNVAGYIGASTTRELWFATHLGKVIRWFEPHNCVEAMQKLRNFNDSLKDTPDELLEFADVPRGTML